MKGDAEPPAFADPEDADKDRGRTPRQAYGYLAVIIATWAGNWPMMRLALAHTEPMVFVSMRMAGSIAILAPILARCPVRCCRSGESGSPFSGSASSK